MTAATSGGLVQLARDTIYTLRDAAASGSGVDALRDAGHSGGSALYDALRDWLRADGGDDPAQLTLAEFSSRARDFFAGAGWGNVVIRSSHDALAVVEIEQCWEAESGGREGTHGCHVTTGALAGFLQPLAGYPLAVMEVECARETGACCRFLAGNEQMLDDAYQRIVAGESWETVGAE